MFELINNDCLDFLRLDTRKWDCIFADPPDNLGLKYNSYKDQRNDYYEWIELIIREALIRTPVFWLSYYHTHDLEFKYRIRNIFTKWHPAWTARQFIWHYNFGQYRETDAPSDHRIILRLSSPVWKPVMTERVESVREKMGDLRATGKGRVPGDVWEFCRVQGNNSERRPWHPTQHPEAIYQRIAMMSGGNTFLDLFAGTGTCFRAIKDRDVTGIELDPFYCEQIRKEHN